MNIDAKTVLKSALGQFFMYNKYPVAIIELRKAISNQAYYRDNWFNVIKLILDKNFIEGEPLKIMENDANLSIYENSDNEALKWFNLLIINSVMSESSPVIDYEDFFKPNNTN